MVKKKLEELPKGWQDTIFKMMGAGKPIQSVLVEFDISRTIHGRFMTDHPEYKEAFNKGDLLREKYIEEQVLLAATDKDSYKGNATMLILAAKNILGWRSEPFQKERDNVLDKTESATYLEQFKKKEKSDEKTISRSDTVN